MTVMQDEVFGRQAHVEKMAGALMHYAKGELQGTERTAVEVHLEACAACRLELVHMRRAVAEEQSAWAQGRALVREFVAKLLPEEAADTDSVWAFMESRGLLGLLPSDAAREPLPQVGFVPPGGEHQLPAVLAMLTSILHGVISEGLAPQEAVARVRKWAKQTLVADARMTDQQLLLLEDFGALIKESSIVHLTDDERDAQP